jgi:CTP:molybdopterin cytidylyltransferase MocA
MMAAVSEHLHELMTQSLVAWRLTGSVRAMSDGAILVTCEEHNIRIEPAPSDLPFRWIVIVDDRRRAAISLVAVLRMVRAALDPGYAALPARIAPFPLVPT